MVNNEYWIFLEKLRRSGVTNMFGAAPYLMDAFDVEYDEAKNILLDWMKHYNRDDYEDMEYKGNNYYDYEY